MRDATRLRKRAPRRLTGLLVAMLVVASGLVVVQTKASRAHHNGRDYEHRLRHSFSLVPGLPGGKKNEPTSCYDIPDTRDYVCRLVAGYEEVGSRETFSPDARDVLKKDSHPVYGITLVTADGIQYEGCTDELTESDAHGTVRFYHCDYETRRHISRRHYEDKRWVLRVFWDWARYTGDQASCAAALSGLWGGAGGKARFLALVNDCKNGPLEDPGRDR